MRIEVEERGSRNVARLVDRLGRRLHNPRPQLLGLVDRLTAIQQERFAGKGVRWRKLKPETLRLDAAQGRDPRPVVLTGQLMRSVTWRGAPGQVVIVRGDELRFGTRIFYARFQKQMGRNPVGATRAHRATLVEQFRRLLFDDI